MFERHKILQEGKESRAESCQERIKRDNEIHSSVLPGIQ